MGIRKLEIKDIVKDYKQKIQIDKSYYNLADSFPIKTILNDQENKIALDISQRLLEFLNSSTEVPPKGVVEYFKALTVMIHEYEKNRFKTKKFNGKEMLAYLMEVHDLNQTDLKDEVGGQSVVSKLLSGERKFNMKQIVSLSNRFNVEPSLFIES